jgi:glutamate dehydrogenase/leucine dehydrogenase
VSPDALRLLSDRGVLIVPDFVANCGGVLGGTLAFAGVPEDRITATIEERLRRAVQSLLREAERQGDSLQAIAEGLALVRHERARHAAESPGVGGRLLAVGLGIYRRGWMPRSLVAALTPRYVERRLLQ